MPEITVTRFTDTQFRVRVTEGRSETVHEVTLTDTDLQRYCDQPLPASHSKIFYTATALTRRQRARLPSVE